MSDIKTNRSKVRTRGKRAGLDLHQIVEAARSLDANMLSMQSLADFLNVDRKALNYHVKDRQTLLNLVAKDMFSCRFSSNGIAKSKNWQDACRLYAMDLVDGLTALDGLAEHFNESLASWGLEPTEALFGWLGKAGFKDDVAVRLVAMLVTLCMGFARDAIQVKNSADRPRPRTLRAALANVDVSKFENLARIADLEVDTYNRKQMEFNLEIFLLGANAILQPEV
ncbi:hypothetical protein RN629_14315 [Sphingomonadaceae bacterium jetA1]|uniref:hypothetical protein n=1 Tax=Facivitalis istanbulensis TaxID=3075838 RepID=UPI003472C8CD